MGPRSRFNTRVVAPRDVFRIATWCARMSDYIYLPFGQQEFGIHGSLVCWTRGPFAIFGRIAYLMPPWHASANKCSCPTHLALTSLVPYSCSINRWSTQFQREAGSSCIILREIHFTSHDLLINRLIVPTTQALSNLRNSQALSQVHFIFSQCYDLHCNSLSSFLSISLLSFP